MANPNRYYSSTASRTQLTVSVSSSATTLTVASTTGFPSSTPFTLLLDAGTASEEIVSVTNISGTTLTVIRGEDGSPATSHGVGCDVRHGATARDFREPQEHIVTASGVHGVTGDIVGTTDAQALQNKTLDSSNQIDMAAVTGLTGALAAAGRGTEFRAHVDLTGTWQKKTLLTIPDQGSHQYDVYLYAITMTYAGVDTALSVDGSVIEDGVGLTYPGLAYFPRADDGSPKLQTLSYRTLAPMFGPSTVTINHVTETTIPAGAFIDILAVVIRR